MIFWCQSCGEQHTSPYVASVNITVCAKCGGRSFATWQPNYALTRKDAEMGIPGVIRNSTWKTPELRESAAKLVEIIISEYAVSSAPAEPSTINDLMDFIEEIAARVGVNSLPREGFSQAILDAIDKSIALSLESVREEALEERFWVVEAVNEDDTALSPPGYWYGGFVGSTVAGHVGSDIHALCTRFQNAQTAEYVKCLLRNAKIKPDRGHHWKIFKHAIALQHAPARVAEVPEGEQCWLIERTYAKGQPAERREFWLGITPGDVHRDSFDSNNELWTTNALEAARFSSLYIAKVLCYRHFHPESTVEACEHRLLKLGQEKPTHFRWGNGGMVADPKGGYVWVGPPPPGRL